MLSWNFLILRILINNKFFLDIYSDNENVGNTGKNKITNKIFFSSKAFI